MSVIPPPIVPPHGTFKKIQFGDGLTATQVDPRTVRVDAGGGDGIKYDVLNVGDWLNVATVDATPPLLVDGFQGTWAFTGNVASGSQDMLIFNANQVISPDWKTGPIVSAGMTQKLIYTGTSGVVWQGNYYGHLEIKGALNTAVDVAMQGFNQLNSAITGLSGGEVVGNGTSPTSYPSLIEVKEWFQWTPNHNDVLTFKFKFTFNGGQAKFVGDFFTLTPYLPGSENSGMIFRDDTGGGITLQTEGYQGAISLESINQDGIIIHSDGNGPIDIESSGGIGGMRFENDGDGLLMIRQTGGPQWPNGTTDGNAQHYGVSMMIENDGGGALNIRNDGNGPLIMTSAGGADDYGMRIYDTGGGLILESSFDVTVHAGGDLVIETTGVGANIKMPGLPTADPHVVNAIWNSGGTMKISAG